MNENRILKTEHIIGHLRETRLLFDGRINRQVRARRVIWEMLDFLLDQSDYPVHELIREIDSLFGDENLEIEFERGILRAVNAHLIVKNNAANENFIFKTGFEDIPIRSSIWRMHNNAIKTRSARITISSENKKRIL